MADPADCGMTFAEHACEAARMPCRYLTMLWSHECAHQSRSKELASCHPISYKRR